MEADTPFVGAEGAVALHPETAVDVELATVIGPGDTEDDDTLRLCNPFQDLQVDELGVLGNVRSDAFSNFPDCLVEFGLARILGYETGHEAVYVLFSKIVH